MSDQVDFKKVPLLFQRNTRITNVLGNADEDFSAGDTSSDAVPVLFEYPNGNLTVASPVGYRLGSDKPYKRTRRSVDPLESGQGEAPESDDDDVGSTASADSAAAQVLPNEGVSLIGDRAYGPFELAEQRKLAYGVYGFAVTDAAAVSALWLFYRIFDIPLIAEAESALEAAKAPMVIQVLPILILSGLAIVAAKGRSEKLLTLYLQITPLVFFASVTKIFLFGYYFHFGITLACWLNVRSLRDRLIPSFVNVGRPRNP